MPADRPDERTSAVARRHRTCAHQPEATTAELADRQYGVVARRQLLALGVTPAMLRSRLGAGVLIPLHRGIYAVGHRRLRREGGLAAILWAGPGAVLSHREAAALHGLRKSDRPRVDVTTTHRGRRGAQGVELHRTTLLGLDDVTEVAGIPVTTVARTLVDLATVVPPEGVATALRELEAAMRRTRTRRGRSHAALERALAERRQRGTQLTRSVLEDRFLRLCEVHGLPRPRANFHIDGVEVDACWPARRLVVELDGWARHRDRHAFQRDRTEANELTRAGWRVLRFTHDDVVRRPAPTAATINAFLADA